MNVEALRRSVEALAAAGQAEPQQELALIEALLDALEDGTLRAAERGPQGWSVNRWVKQGILLAFRLGGNRGQELPPVFYFRDRAIFTTWDPNRCERNVRVVPGGSTVRRGAYLGQDVVVMPPAYVNVGAWVGVGSMIDSHVLVGSCAQVGSRVHLSAAAQIGGVLEPVGAMPVIVEDEVFVGGGCGIYEGTRVGARAVLAPGVILTRAVPIYDLVRQSVYRAGADGVLVVPEGAVVVPGARRAESEFARQHGVHLQTPVIVKYRDSSTDAAVALEEGLR